jgi:hypothetical protein
MRRFVIVGAALFVLLLDGNLPTPLYRSTGSGSGSRARS